MNVRKVYESVKAAIDLTTDVTVGSYLNVAIEELEAHMEKEKARVSKYRTKEYKEKKKDHVHVEGGVCPTCGTVVDATAEVRSRPTPEIDYAEFEARVLAERAKAVEETRIELPVDDPLSIIDEEIPKIASYEGVEDDLEGDEPDTEDDELEDDLESILSL